MFFPFLGDRAVGYFGVQIARHHARCAETIGAQFDVAAMTVTIVSIAMGAVFWRAPRA